MNSPPFSPGISSSLQNGLRGARVLAGSQLIGRGDTRAMVKLYWNAFSPGKQVNKQVIIVSFLKSSKWETNPTYKPVLPAQRPQFESTMATAFLIKPCLPFCNPNNLIFGCRRNNRTFCCKVFWSFELHSVTEDQTNSHPIPLFIPPVLPGCNTKW